MLLPCVDLNHNKAFARSPTQPEAKLKILVPQRYEVKPTSSTIKMATAIYGAAPINLVGAEGVEHSQTLFISRQDVHRRAHSNSRLWTQQHPTGPFRSPNLADVERVATSFARALSRSSPAFHCVKTSLYLSLVDFYGVYDLQQVPQVSRVYRRRTEFQAFFPTWTDDLYVRHFELIKLSKLLVGVVLLSHYIACNRFSFGYDEHLNYRWLPSPPLYRATAQTQYLVPVFWPFVSPLDSMKENSLTVPTNLFSRPRSQSADSRYSHPSARPSS